MYSRTSHVCGSLCGSVCESVCGLLIHNNPLFQLMAELNAIRNEKEAVNKSLDRIKMEHELATKNVSLLRIENER